MDFLHIIIIHNLLNPMASINADKMFLSRLMLTHPDSTEESDEEEQLQEEKEDEAVKQFSSLFWESSPVAAVEMDIDDLPKDAVREQEGESMILCGEEDDKVQSYDLLSFRTRSAAVMGDYSPEECPTKRSKL